MKKQKMFSVINKISNDNKLGNEFFEKLAYIKSLKSIDGNTDLLKKAWDELYKFALSVESDVTIEEFENFCESVLDEEDFDNISAGIGYSDGQMIGKFLRGIVDAVIS